MSMNPKVREALMFWVNYSKDVMIKNMEFLLNRYRNVIDSCYDLFNDVIDIESWIAPNKSMDESKRMGMVIKYLMYPMLIHVIYPNLNFLCIEIMLGAIPQAFYTLRTILEAFVIALYADTKEELKNLVSYEKVEHESVRNATVFGVKDHILKVLTKVFGDRECREWLKYILELYQAISAWVHPVARIKLDKEKEITAGVLRAIMITVAQRGVPPSYGLVIPMEYDEEDLDNLKHLNEIIKHTRLAITMIAYTWSINKNVADREALRKRFEELSKVIQTS